MHVFISSRLDYYNPLFTCFIHLLLSSSGCLFVLQLIFKILLLTFKALHDQALSYCTLQNCQVHTGLHVS